MSDFDGLSLEQLLTVKIRTASLHSETLSDAPASVTVISQQEIRKFGYRTLAEALRYVPGFYERTDRTYTTTGLRGFSLPADYGTRLLVLIDGHNMSMGPNRANSFGLDFPLDLNLVKQIEVVRGPTSALYGSSGVLATINIITVKPENQVAPEVRAETGSLGEKKLQVSSSVPLGRGMRTLVSGSLFHHGGEGSIYVPEYDTPETGFGQARDMDGERGYHLFGKIDWKNWSAVLLASSRLKVQPISFGPTTFNDPGTSMTDQMGLADVAYTKQWNETSLEWHTFFQSYRLRGNFHSELHGGPTDTRERDADDWVGANLALRFPLRRLGDLTLGAEARINTYSLMNQFDVQPAYQEWVRIRKPDAQLGIFVQDELQLSSRWKLNLGLRADRTRHRSTLLAPRAALIYRHSPESALKFLYGRSFRNPTPFEMFFEDGVSSLSNPAASAEKSHTFEAVAERRLRKRLLASLSLYHYQIDGILMGVFTPQGPLQFINRGHNHSYGIESAIGGRAWGELEIAASMAFQRTFDEPSGLPFPNSPGQVGKAQASYPIFRNKLSLAAGLQFLGRRQTLAGATLPRLYLPEVILSSSRLSCGMDLQVGVRNLLNRRYTDPIALNAMVDTIRNPGRAFFVTLSWRTPEP